MCQQDVKLTLNGVYVHVRQSIKCTQRSIRAKKDKSFLGAFFFSAEGIFILALTLIIHFYTICSRTQVRTYKIPF